MIRTTLVAAAAASLLAVGACSDTTDDVVQAPAPGATPAPVTEQRAEAVQDAVAPAFGMTRQELEDADLVSSSYTDIGDVDSLVLDANGVLTHVVIELEGPGDRKVSLPISQVRGIAHDDGKFTDLTTDLGVSQLAALPEWTPAPAR